MQNIAAMSELRDPARTGEPSAPSAARQGSAPSSDALPAVVPVKRAYEPPRVERRIPIVANTLISGSECTLPGDPCE